MLNCFHFGKCKWCNKRKHNNSLWKIDIWCKWYGLKICDECYDKKASA